jgi:hypothetical protein
MFGWWNRWLERESLKYIRELAAETQAIKDQWRAEHGDEPFPIPPEQRERLRQMRSQLDPEFLKKQGLEPEEY